MKLEHPDEVDQTEQTSEHPFSPDHVETAWQMADTDLSLTGLHQYLETVQASLEHELNDRPSLYDPLDLLGEQVHRVEWWDVPTPYAGRLHLEDGYYLLNSEHAQRMVIAGKQAREELADEIDFDDMDQSDYEKVHETQNVLANDVDLDSYTLSEIKEHATPKHNIWEQVADILSVDRDSGILRAVKLTHELCYNDNISVESEHATTGFVVGLPEMFLAGMRTEQRLFSALVETKISPAQIVDLYGNRVSYTEANKWGSKRGVSASAVSQNRKNGVNNLKDKYLNGTYPANLTSGW